MEKGKGIIFDFNGTLFFDDEKHVLAWKDISRMIRGVEFTKQEVCEKLNGSPNSKNVQYMMNGKATQEEIEKYSLQKEEIYRDYCRKDQETFHLVEGVTLFFDQLKKDKIPFTIASASIKENMDFFIESFGLDRWIAPENIVYDDGTYDNKVVMFQKAAEMIGVSMEDVIIYEDSPTGIGNAYAAGCRHIVAICEKEKAEEYLQYDGVVRTIEDFTQESLR